VAVQVDEAREAIGDDPAATRVADSQRQAAGTLRISVGFLLAAAAAAASGAGEGPWLALHLLLVGGTLTAIAASTQHLAVTWSAAPAPSDRLVGAQRWCLGLGAAGVAIGRELDLQVLAGGGAAAVAVGLALLARSLLAIRRQGRTDRFHPAIDAYLAGLACATGGIGLGTWMAVASPGAWWPEVRAAHVTLNLFGLVGATIAGTLPTFAATQVRARMHPRATARRQRQAVGAIVAGVAATATGQLAAAPALAATGRAAQLAGWLAVVSLLPHVGGRELRRAGPRVVHLAAGATWWLAVLAALVPADLDGRAPATELLAALAVGGVAQVLVGSLAYLGPVLRGGGHVRLAEGFRATRSWTSLAVANVAALSLLADRRGLAGLAIGAWAVDVAWRAARLRSPATPT